MTKEDWQETCDLIPYKTLAANLKYHEQVCKGFGVSYLRANSILRNEKQQQKKYFKITHLYQYTVNSRYREERLAKINTEENIDKRDQDKR